MDDITIAVFRVRDRIAAEGAGAPQKYSWIALAAAKGNNPDALAAINTLLERDADTPLLPLDQWIIDCAISDLLTSAQSNALDKQVSMSLYSPAIVDREAANYIGNRLSAIRRAAGITKQQLAEAAGISITAIEKYENGTRRLAGASLDTALKIAKALNVPVEKLI